MRRRTIQYLVLLAIVGLSTHLYFHQSFSLTSPEWLDDYTRFEGSSEAEGDAPVGDKRPPYAQGPPPPPPKDSTRPNLTQADEQKRDAVVDAFKHAWSAYEKHAMGDDEYHPISQRGSNLGMGGGIGYTVVDAIDTMVLMGLDAEYQRARSWVQEHLSFDRSGYFSTFETTIRVLGGLLSAYHLTGDDLYKSHAADLGDRMLPAFDTASGLPAPSVNLAARTATSSRVSISEATTLQLEFRYLAEITGRVAFSHKAEKVMEVVNRNRIPNGLVPIDMNADGTFARSGIRLGSNGDSYYGNNTFKLTRMDELTAAGVRDWETGVAFLETCMGTHRTATGLSPEGVHFRTTADPKGERDWYIKGANKAAPPYDARYMLRLATSLQLFNHVGLRSVAVIGLSAHMISLVVNNDRVLRGLEDVLFRLIKSGRRDSTVAIGKSLHDSKPALSHSPERLLGTNFGGFAYSGRKTGHEISELIYAMWATPSGDSEHDRMLLLSFRKHFYCFRNVEDFVSSVMSTGPQNILDLWTALEKGRLMDFDERFSISGDRCEEGFFWYPYMRAIYSRKLPDIHGLSSLRPILDGDNEKMCGMLESSVEQAGTGAQS
ncbi:glycoside hydrolase [Mycena galopus ATCC 62051]|nr:glycoside hydrolase [Mycena galopus ATCC 62051]